MFLSKTLHFVFWSYQTFRRSDGQVMCYIIIMYNLPVSSIWAFSPLLWSRLLDLELASPCETAVIWSSSAGGDWDPFKGCKRGQVYHVQHLIFKVNFNLKFCNFTLVQINKHLQFRRHLLQSTLRDRLGQHGILFTVCSV